MSKKSKGSKTAPAKPKAPECAVRPDGIIHVGQQYDNPTEPYVKVRRKDIPDYLGMVDHELTFASKKDYEEAQANEEKRLNINVRKLAEAKKFVAVVFQGRDSSGKSGAVTRISEALDHDAKLFRSVPIGPPTDEERSHPPQWRFFRDDRMPAYGQFRVYDRSWWEEVLVVPVMKLKPKEVWQKAYALNRTMEWMFMQEGGIVVNLWFDITKAEQKRRFKARAEEKPWKLSPSDGEARKKWKQYTRAANEMFFRGRSWYIVSSEDKRYSRVHVLKIINERIEAALGCPATDSKNAPKLVKKGDKHAKRNK